LRGAIFGGFLEFDNSSGTRPFLELIGRLGYFG